MGSPISNESTRKELTDEQCFRQMVEAFAAMRSVKEKRKFPRFPTVAALSRKLGVYGFEGLLVCEEADSSGDSVKNPDVAKGLGGLDNPIRKINLVDFSEDGVQLRLNSSDLLRLQGRSLYLEIMDFRLSVRSRWCMHSGFDGEGGFSFVRKIDSDENLARFVSTLNTRLIDFLVNEYSEHPALFTRQAGIFMYLAIYYGLRLKFLEIVSEINHLTSTVEAGYPSEVRDVVHQTLHDFNYSSSYHREQAFRNISDPRLKKLLRIYMKPFYAFGCGIPGMRPSMIFLRDDAWAAILNSVFFAEADCQSSAKILPGLLPLHHSFLHLKELLPGVFEEEELDNQFRYYSKIIFEIELLRERVVDNLSSLGKTDLSSSAKEPRTETTYEVLPQEAIQEFRESPQPLMQKVPRAFLIFVLVAVVAAVAFYSGLWFGRRTGPVVVSPPAKKGSAPLATSTMQLPDRVTPPAGSASSTVAGKEMAGSGDVTTGASTPAIPADEKGSTPQTASTIQPPDRVAPPAGSASSIVAGKEMAGSGDVTSGARTSAIEKQPPATPDEKSTKADEGTQAPIHPPQPQKHIFEIEADQEAWVQVKTGNKIVYSALMKPGEKREWETKQNLQIVLGNAGGVRMKWDGVAFGPIGKQGEPVRFQLPNPKYTAESGSSTR